jgi:hypothetical protein
MRRIDDPAFFCLILTSIRYLKHHNSQRNNTDGTNEEERHLRNGIMIFFQQGSVASITVIGVFIDGHEFGQCRSSKDDMVPRVEICHLELDVLGAVFVFRHKGGWQNH